MRLMNEANLWLVGGIVRDRLLDVPCKDVDISVEFHDAPITPEVGLERLQSFLTEEGWEICDVTEDKGVVKAKSPKDHPFRSLGDAVVDFVLCRKEGPYSDGRRPDWVNIGTFEDDLQRRDFTVNALAVPIEHAHGFGLEHVITLGNGIDDVRTKTLRFVGEPEQRIREDALRVMRALRFCVTKGFRMAPSTHAALTRPETAELLALISEERREDELNRMLRFDTLDTLDCLERLPKHLRRSIFAGRVRLTTTLKKGTKR